MIILISEQGFLTLGLVTFYIGWLLWGAVSRIVDI